MRLDIEAPNGIDKNTWENFQKLFNNEWEWYEKNPPFRRAETTFQTILSLFWNVKLVRWMIGGAWVKGSLGMWLPVTKNFKKEWTLKYPFEDYDKEPKL